MFDRVSSPPLAGRGDAHARHRSDNGVGATTGAGKTRGFHSRFRSWGRNVGNRKHGECASGWREMPLFEVPCGRGQRRHGSQWLRAATEESSGQPVIDVEIWRTRHTWRAPDLTDPE